VRLKQIYHCYKVNNIHKALETTSICINNKIIPIFFIKFYLINKFGPDWVIEFKNLLLKKFNKKNFKIYADCRNNYGLFINLVRHKIDFLKVRGNDYTLLQLKQIAMKNKITINPKIDIIDLTKIKKIKFVINKNIKRK